MSVGKRKVAERQVGEARMFEDPVELRLGIEGGRPPAEQENDLRPAVQSQRGSHAYDCR